MNCILICLHVSSSIMSNGKKSLPEEAIALEFGCLEDAVYEKSSHAGITGTVFSQVEMEGVQFGVTACNRVGVFWL